MRKLLWLLLLAGLGLALALPLLAQEIPPAAESDPAAEEGVAPGDVAPPVDEGELAVAGEAGELTLEESETPPPPPVALPVPTDLQVIDVANDSGANAGALWYWDGEVDPTTRFWILVKADPKLLDQYKLTDAETARLDSAVTELQDALNASRDRYDGRSVIQEMEAAAEATDSALSEYQMAFNNKDPMTGQLRRAYYTAKQRYDAAVKARGKINDRFIKKAARLMERQQYYDYLSATIAASEFVPTDKIQMPAAGVRTKGSATNRFLHNPEQPDKLYLEISEIKPFYPGVFDGSFQPGMMNQYDEEVSQSMSIPFSPGASYTLQMVVYNNPPDLPEGAELNFEEVLALDDKQVYDLGAVTPRVNYFDVSKLNNFIFAIAFAAIILIAIMLARRNPNLFIRRISGLEAVDEAIGRATEMGKPVLYLTGLDPLSNLATLAAINILGRVARRIADYESDLIVPQRDPVAMTVCQEVVRESYLDAGRPDVYREDNIFFVTEDQFSFTATTCAIMVRERPAANFFMGYYYAESLLLAETGAATGAIQIAGTDALHQLPFFIVTCDYTLIGEELYAASAYLSREPMLLGSLKGQDVGKALIMVIIVLQTLLFLFSPELDWIKLLVEAL